MSQRNISRKHSTWDIARKNLCMHVTAIKTFGDYLLIAEGNQISLLVISLKRIVGTEEVFISSSIHGIRIGKENKIIFFGSKSLRVYACDPTLNKCFTSLSAELFLSDWIHDAQWLTDCDGSSKRVAAILAHNSITIFDIQCSEKMNNVQCSENCILYSASIINPFESNLVVGVGTVFKQILLWSPNSSSNSNAVKVPFHCLEGHQGVIFSITYNKHHRLLSSTSDDRSIRLWKILSSSDDDSSLEFWMKSSIFLSHVLFAHESRVWISAILNNCIISVGEDSFICFWDLNGHLLKKKKCHKGGSIWCLETNYTDKKKTESDSFSDCLAFTGGSDGGVYCWDIQNVIDTDFVSQISLHDGSSKHDFPRVVSIVLCNNDPKLMVTTDRGWLSIYDMNLQVWKDIYYDFSFVSYCVSAVSSESTIALGNLNGDLVLLSCYDDLSCKTDVKKFKIHSGKIFSLHWVDSKSKHLLSCSAKGYMVLWGINFHDNEYSISKIYEYHLPRCKPHWWSTCAIFLHPSNCLIVGDRGGNVSFYSHINDFTQRIKPSVVHKYIHGENGVTDIQEHESLIYSSGRDGRVLLYSVTENSLNILHAIKTSHDVEWIGKMLFSGSDLLVLGFHTKYFVVWSTKLESTIMSVDCGGGHRSWDFHLTDDGKATFVAIKRKDIMFAKENLYFTLNNSVLKAGISGREFCQTCYLFTIDFDDSKSMSVLASGGEDNTLQIIGFIDDESKHSEIKSLYSLHGHLSSIRSLAKTSMIEDNTFLLASVGGRAQMILWKIKNGSSIICEQLASFILFSFEKKNKKPWKESQNIQMDPQTRLMDVTLSMSEATRCGNEMFTIALACSDSYFRVFNFDTTEKSLDLLYDVQLVEHCILKLSCLQNPEMDTDIFFLIATTDGNVNFASYQDMKSKTSKQSANSEAKLLDEKSHHKIRLHQSGINALDVSHIFENAWLVCTAGDDNAISAIVIEVSTDLELDGYFKVLILTQTQVPNAHASQITGLKIVGLKTIISVSIDQRINIWKWSFESNSLTITIDESKISLIPDIAHLECWKNGSNSWTAVVCGEGIERLSIKNITER